MAKPPMSAQGLDLNKSVEQLQGHLLDYGMKCRNACYSGIAASWALLASGNMNGFFFAASCACFLSALAVDISISSDGATILIQKIVDAQKKSNTSIDYTAEEAVAFARRGETLKCLVYTGFSLIAAGYIYSTINIKVPACGS